MSKITNTFTKLTQKQLEQKKAFIDNYIKAHNAAEGSTVDANSNVTNKNVATLTAELNKDFNVQIKRYCISQKIKELFGEDLAKEYNRQIENHEIYIHDESHPFFDYCASVTLYPFLLNGLKGLGGESVAPKHLESFCGSFINLVFALSSQLAGAVATVEFLICFDYFARKDYGDNYLETHKKIIENALQQIVYSMNQPASARGFQSIFWNISIFDDNYLKSLFGEFVFPDYSKPNFETVKKLQAFFMNWFNEERRRALLTFPVITAAMVVDENGPLDQEFLDMCAEQDSKGNSFFKYESDSVDSLASCCFSKDQKVLARFKDKIYYEPFGTLGLTKDGPNRENFSIFHNGSWCNGKLIRLSNRKMFKIITANNKEIIVSDNHLNPTLNGDVRTSNLSIDDYLLFNNMQLESFHEKDLGLTYEQGYAVGAFLGDGSFDAKRTLTTGEEVTYGINFSLNKTKLNRSTDKLNKALKQFGSINTVNIYEQENKELVPVTLSCKEMVKFIKYWTDWQEGTRAFNKKLNLKCLLQSADFRKGILDGLYDTDGGNSNRIYTISKTLSEHIEVLATSLGLNTIINLSDRTGEIAFEENGKSYTRNYPLYCIRYYLNKNRRSMKDVYIIKNNSIYFKIKSIEKIDYKDDIYCFEMENKNEPYFTLPNGIITHNCRLRNELQDNTFSFTLGAGGTQAGSINVITININRLVQNATRQSKDIESELKLQVEKIHKYQVATKAYYMDYYNAGMMPLYTLGFLSLDKKFLTIGINGFIEAAEFKGLSIDNNQEYLDFTTKLLKVIYGTNKEGKAKYGVMFNTEFVPAENLGVKNYAWDKADGYVVPESRDCYNSYLYKVEDSEIDAIDKFILHGKQNLQYLDGGSALHLNLEEYPTKESYKKLYGVAAKTGCNYWTTNVKVTICEDCGYINKHTVNECTKCHSKNVSYATRVIGYLRKISNFSPERQKEADKRFYTKVK